MSRSAHDTLMREALPGPAAAVAPYVFACPACRGALQLVAPDEQRCPECQAVYRCVAGVWRFLMPERADYFAPFLRDYTTIRSAEGYGYADPMRYRRLPEVAPDDPLAWQWRMRARSFDCLRRRVLTRGRAGLAVLDLGAGVGWLSNRLTLLGCHACAVDLNVDLRDGLGAAQHYDPSWLRVQAEFELLPLADDQADLVVYNASLHYSTDYRTTLREALRVLRPAGRIVVMDTPIYRYDASGRQMIAERQAAFARIHGTRSDTLPNIGYLTWAMLRELARDLALRWRVITPWYGWRWALRPWRARLTGAREPSRFALLIAERDSAYALPNLPGS